MKKLILLSLFAIFIASCTENQRAKTFGGSGTIKLNKNEVLLNLTWKENNLWLFVEDTASHKKYFREDSNFGLMEGKMEIINN